MHRALIVLSAALGLGACERERVPTASAPPSVITDQQAIDAATAKERAYQQALAQGDLAFLPDCAPGGTEAVRLVDMADDGAQGYSLAMTTDARGAVAIWQGIRRLPSGAYEAYGARGMRLDGNAWRQARQALVDPDFAAQARSDTVAPGTPPVDAGRGTRFVYCLEGERRTVVEPGDGTGQFAFERAAVTLRRLAGNHYSPPGSSAP